jgi:hypothetical protein
MTGRRFPPPWSVEELDAMTRPTKSKMGAIKPEPQDFDAVEKEYGPLPIVGQVAHRGRGAADRREWRKADGFYPCRTANSSILIRSSLGNSCGV